MKTNRTPDLSKLRRGLFWDTDFEKIDWQRQKRAVLPDEKQCACGLDQILSEIENELNPKP